MMSFDDGLTNLERMIFVNSRQGRVPPEYQKWADEYRQSVEFKTTAKQLLILSWALIGFSALGILCIAGLFAWRAI